MRQRFSGSVGAIALGLIAVNTACGSRANLFVLDDETFTGGGTFSGGGSASHAGTGGAHSGGRAGTSSGGVGAYAGGGVGAYAGGGVGAYAGGGVGAYAGTGFGLGGSGVGGASMDWCAACLAHNTDGNPCEAASCNLKTNLCDVVPMNEGVACNGTDRCTVSNCRSGQCVRSSAVTCPSTTPCMASACDPQSGMCVAMPSSTGTPCEDGDPCTVQDQCVAGKCLPGSATVACKNNDQCCPAACSSSSDNDCSDRTEVTLDTSDRGWYEETGAHDPLNKNTFTGSSPPHQYNSFFIFDLSGITRTIIAARLDLVVESFYGVELSEVASIWDVSTKADALSSTRQSTAIFQDLQSGAQYSNVSGTANLLGVVTAYLTGQAIDDLNAARGSKFAVGVHIDSLSLQTEEGLRFSAQNEPEANRLVLGLR